MRLVHLLMWPHVATRPTTASHLFAMALGLCAITQPARAADPCAALFRKEPGVVSAAGPTAALAELTRLGDGAPESDAPADPDDLAQLCLGGHDCPTTPFGVKVRTLGLTALGLLVPDKPIGVVRIAQVIHEYQCSGAAEVTTQAHSAGWVRVYGYSADPLVKGLDEAGHACEPEGGGCIRSCWSGKKEPFDWWVHPASGQVLSRRTPKRPTPTVKDTQEGPRVGACLLRGDNAAP